MYVEKAGKVVITSQREIWFVKTFTAVVDSQNYLHHMHLLQKVLKRMNFTHNARLCVEIN